MNKEQYLKKIRRALWAVNGKKKKEIILELNSEISERLKNGEKIEDILTDMPEPKNMRKEYFEIYGLSLTAKFILILVPAIISIFTLSVIPLTSILFYGAPAFLILLAILLFYISTNFGMKIGLVASITAATLRFVLIYLTSLHVLLQNGTLLTEGITSLIILIIPVFGKKKK